MFRQQWCKWGEGDGMVMVAGSNLATVFVFFNFFSILGGRPYISGWYKAHEVTLDMSCVTMLAKKKSEFSFFSTLFGVKVVLLFLE